MKPLRLSEQNKPGLSETLHAAYQDSADPTQLPAEQAAPLERLGAGLPHEVQLTLSDASSKPLETEPQKRRKLEREGSYNKKVPRSMILEDKEPYILPDKLHALGPDGRDSLSGTRVQEPQLPKPRSPYEPL